MPKLIASAVAVLVVVSLGCMRMNGAAVQGSGVRKSEERKVDRFDNITLAGSAKIFVTVGGETTVTVETDDNILPIIETDVAGDTLTISSHETYSTKLGVKVTITTPSLSGISIKGAGDVDIKGLSGGSFSAGIHGSGDVKATGSVDRLDCSIRGSGDLEMGDLQARTASVSVAGSGDVTVNATDELSVSIAGSGDVKYKGKPAKLEKSIAGSGNVRQVG